MNTNTEDFIYRVEAMIADDELPDPLNDFFGLLDLKELVTRVYEEVLESIEYPNDGTAEEQAEAIREFTEQVAMKVGAIAALSAQAPKTKVGMSVKSETLTELLSQLLKSNEVNIMLTTE